MCEIIVLLSYEPGTRSEIALYYVPRRVRFKIECSRLVPVPYFGVTNRKALLHGSLGFRIDFWLEYSLCTWIKDGAIGFDVRDFGGDSVLARL